MLRTRLPIALAIMSVVMAAVSCKNPLGVAGPCPHRKTPFAPAAYVGDFRAYFGNLHAHTGYSDGALDPASAYRHARDVARLDFMAVTDHVEVVSQGLHDQAVGMARAETAPGKFAALPGFEWSHGLDLAGGKLYNHVNVIGSAVVPPLLETATLDGFYCHLLALPEGAVGQFNHPSYRKPPLETNHWDSLRYDAYVDRRITLFECEKGENAAEKGYIPALEAGWHVGPVSNQDNHHADWGSKRDNRAGVWAAELTPSGILRALREMRTFSTTDKDATVRLMAEKRYWMGSVLARTGPVELDLEAVDPGKGESFVKIELIARGGLPAEVRAISVANRVTATFRVDPKAASYFFARVTQADGDELVSAPIWIERR